MLAAGRAPCSLILPDKQRHRTRDLDVPENHRWERLSVHLVSDHTSSPYHEGELPLHHLSAQKLSSFATTDRRYNTLHHHIARAQGSQ